jgi:hypothetical protein
MAVLNLPIIDDIYIYRSRDFKSKIYTLTNPDGSPIDLSASTLSGRIAKKVSQLETDRLLDFSLTKNSAEGSFFFKLTKEQIDLIPETISLVYYDIKWVNSLGVSIQFLLGSGVVYPTITP